LLHAAPLFAQEETVLPPRFQALTKDGRFRLARVLGSPEIQASFGPTSAFSADGSQLAYVPFYLLDLTTLSRAFLPATVHLVLFGMVVRMFSARKDRDFAFLAALAFVMVLASAVRPEPVTARRVPQTLSKAASRWS
jgi:hypothetical protein